MRLWTIHPKYLDGKRLTSQWKEGIQMMHIWKEIGENPEPAKRLGYVSHPQVRRLSNLLVADSGLISLLLHQHLTAVHEESVQRSYSFNKKLIDDLAPDCKNAPKVYVTMGQVAYEFALMATKNNEWSQKVAIDPYMLCNPIFQVVSGSIESWEKTKDEVLAILPAIAAALAA